jgi:UDP-N-acetylglucosamine--N-acetylmuramyl-(pentapeptide) pyrophosphoryl-undecaprenol N-acetylglucosamine transferase
VVAARLLGIPAFTHESDLDPGLATRLNARFCERILVSHEATAAHFSPALRDRVVVTGNPVRAAIYAADPAEGRRFAGCAPSDRLVLVLGGSSGSAFLNGLVAGAAPGLCAHGIRIVHQTGDGKQGAEGVPGCRAMPFIGAELPHLVAAADLVVCRAGANTLAELAALGRPSLLVPLSTAGSRGDQLRNAEAFRAAGAAEVMAEQVASPAALGERVLALLGEPARLAAMGAAARALAPSDPAARIAGMIAARLGGGAGGAVPRGSA